MAGGCRRPQHLDVAQVGTAGLDVADVEHSVHAQGGKQGGVLRHDLGMSIRERVCLCELRSTYLGRQAGCGDAYEGFPVGEVQWDGHGLGKNPAILSSKSC